MNRTDNKQNNKRSLFGSLFNGAKGMVNDAAEQIKENQETSKLLSRLSSLERELTSQVQQLFFSDSFGKLTDTAQKEPFIFRRCMEFKKIVPVNQSDKEQLLKKIAEMKSSGSKAAPDDIKALITEVDSYTSKLSQNDKRIALSNINTKALTDVQNSLQSALRSKRVFPCDTNRTIEINSKDQPLNSVFISNVDPLKIRIKNTNTYYLYPDFILVVDNNKYIADILSPDEFQMSVTEKQYTEVYDISKHDYPVSSRIGTDSKIIKKGPEIKHYEHETKNGRPDTRYKENNVVSITRKDLAEVGVLTISVLNEKMEIEFSSSQATVLLKNAVNSYCVKKETTSISGLRLLDLLAAVDDNENNSEIKDLIDRYSRYLDDKNPVCRIVSQGVR